jgi:hypothetical protein
MLAVQSSSGTVRPISSMSKPQHLLADFSISSCHLFLQRCVVLVSLPPSLIALGRQALRLKQELGFAARGCAFPGRPQRMPQLGQAFDNPAALARSCKRAVRSTKPPSLWDECGTSTVSALPSPSASLLLPQMSPGLSRAGNWRGGNDGFKRHLNRRLWGHCR